MGIRADFYVGRDGKAKWLGSIGYNGSPQGIPNEILNATSEDGFRANVENFLKEMDYSTKPEQGWPWPWNNSDTSDYAYAWDNGVWYTTGYPINKWWKHSEGPEPDEDDDNYEEVMSKLENTNFPDMTDLQNVSFGKNSGLVIVTA